MNPFRALTSAFLLSLTAGCASQPQPAIEIRYEQIYIPDSLLAGCPVIPWEGGTYRMLKDLAEARRTALKNCDDRFTAARKYQDDLRQKAKKPL